MKELLSKFPQFNEEQIKKAIEQLEKKDQEILSLRYPLDDSKPLTYKEISDLSGIPMGSLSAKFKKILQKLTEILMNLATEVAPQTSENIPLNSTPQLNVAQDQITVDQIIKLISDDKFGTDNRTYNYDDNTKIRINVALKKCSLATASSKYNWVNTTTHVVTRMCYVYRIVKYDAENKRVFIELVVQEAKARKGDKKEIYKYITRNERDEYDLSGVEEKELVCFNIPDETPINETKKNNAPDKEPPKSVQQPIVNQAVVTTQPKIDNTNTTEIEYAIQNFKDRNVELAEVEFKKLLVNTTDAKSLETINYYLGRIYRTKKNFVLAKKYLEDSLKYNNRNYFVLLELGSLYSQLEIYDQAIKAFEQCEECRKRPNQYGKYSVYSDKIKHLLEMGLCYLQQNQLAKALETFETGIKFNNKDYYAHLDRGIVLFRMGDFEHAEQECEISKQYFESNFRHKLLQGKIYYVTGRQAEAIQIFDSLMENYTIIGDKINACIEIGYFFHSINDEANAKKYYQRTEVFNKIGNLSPKEITANFGNHVYVAPQNNYPNHTNFYVPLELEELQSLIENADPVSIKPMFDIYQIEYNGVGYCTVAPDHINNYLTVLTMPFTKKIVFCYSSDLLPSFVENYSPTINEPLVSSKQSDNDSSIPDMPDVPDVSDITIENQGEIVTTTLDKKKLFYQILLSLVENADSEYPILVLAAVIANGRSFTFLEIANILGIQESKVKITICKYFPKLSPTLKSIDDNLGTVKQLQNYMSQNKKQ